MSMKSVLLLSFLALALAFGGLVDKADATIDGIETIAFDGDDTNDDFGIPGIEAILNGDTDEDILTEGKTPTVRRSRVRKDLALLNKVALVDDGALVDVGALIGTPELEQGVGTLAVLIGDDDPVPLGDDNLAFDIADDHVTRVSSGAQFHPRADNGRVRGKKGDGLTLHIGTHQGAVGVIVF